MNQTRAYNELVSLLIRPEDQEKFEWVIGAILSGSSGHIVVLRGDARTGKTTLTQIARKALSVPVAGNSFPNVAFFEGDVDVNIDPGQNAFVEVNDLSHLELDALVIETTGDRVPVNKHYVLMQKIDDEIVDIAEGCIIAYNSRNEGYFTFQENNR